MSNKFKVGSLVSFKSHPLLKEMYIKGDGKYVPPIMLVKEVFFENKNKKIFDETTGKQIADKIKYICVYFDDNKSEFVESQLYESQLESISLINIARFEVENEGSNRKTLVEEVDGYPNTFEYEFGKIVHFKSKKLEAFKKRESTKIKVDKATGLEEKEITRQYVVNYITPEFVLNGFKKESYNDLFYENGSPKRLVSTDFIKVKWFNPSQHKFSEQFLPIEFFIDFNPFNHITTV